MVLKIYPRRERRICFRLRSKWPSAGCWLLALEWCLQIPFLNLIQESSPFDQNNSSFYRRWLSSHDLLNRCSGDLSSGSLSQVSPEVVSSLMPVLLTWSLLREKTNFLFSMSHASASASASRYIMTLHLSKANSWIEPVCLSCLRVLYFVAIAAPVIARLLYAFV